MNNLRDSGSLILPKIGVVPTNSGAATTNGAAIDRMPAASRAGYLSATLHFVVGAPSGTPDSFTANAKLQESADGSTGWTDITDGAVTQRTAAGTEAEVNVSLAPIKRYIRAVVVVAFVNGTSPALPVAASVVLGGATELPA